MSKGSAKGKLKGPQKRADRAPDAPKPKQKQRGTGTKGMTKEVKPRLANRLPRERGGLVAPAGDGLTPFERALALLGSRVKETKVYYMLDGKPCNATDILKAAGIHT